MDPRAILTFVLATAAFYLMGYFGVWRMALHHNTHNENQLDLDKLAFKRSISNVELLSHSIIGGAVMILAFHTATFAAHVAGYIVCAVWLTIFITRLTLGSKRELERLKQSPEYWRRTP